MSLNYNSCTMAGRLASAPELRQTPNGIGVTTFRLAVNRPTKEGTDQKADFLNVVAWRQTAEFICKYFQKGSAIFVTGSIQTRQYKDKNGNDREAVEVVADTVNFVESKATSGSDSSPIAQAASASFEEIGNDEDLPF